MERKLVIIWIIGTAALSAVILSTPAAQWWVPAAAAVKQKQQPKEKKCMEDQPCWSWPSMGNGRRSVMLVWGRRAIVDAELFALLSRAGWIDWERTPRLRGDADALRLAR